MRVMSLVVRLINERRAITSLEYGMIAGMIVVAIVGTVNGLHTSSGCSFNTIAMSL